MKQQTLVVCLVLLAWLLLAPGVEASYYLDTPHNGSNGMDCATCHSLPAFSIPNYNPNYHGSPTDPIGKDWTTRSGDNPEDTVANTVCLECHGEGSSNVLRGPVKVVHSSRTTGSAGSWSTNCTQCHDPHFQGQLKNIGPGSYAANLVFLATGEFETSNGRELSAYNAAGNYTTIGIKSTITARDSSWSNVANWKAKGGRMDSSRATDGSRGLILVPSLDLHDQTYEIIDVTPNGAGDLVLKVKGNMDATEAYNTGLFGVIYGQSIKSRVMPNGGSTAGDYRDVKFFKPGIIGGQAGGYVDESGSSSPQGLCQVCHSTTAYWKNDGSRTTHNSGAICGDCHNVLKGLGGGTNHTAFIGDFLGTGCGNCHTAQAAAPESGHSAGCATCHLDPKPTITSTILSNDGGLSVRATLMSVGYSFSPRLTDSNGKGVSEPGFQGVDCSNCHQLKRAAVLGGSHGGHGATTFGWDANCVDCHGPSSKEVVKEVHGNTCTVCHDSARVAVKDYTVRIAGNSSYGIDGSAVGATTLSKCTDCHNTSPIGAVHHDSKNGYAAAGNCSFCHTTIDHDHRLSSSCSNCHAASTSTEVDTLHKNCQTCHAYAGSRLNQATVAAVIAAGMADENQTCENCHTVNLHHATREAANNNCTTTCHPSVDHSSTIVNTAPCSECHTNTAGAAAGAPVSFSDTQLHSSCLSCHTFDGNLRGGLVNFTNRKGVNGSGTLPNGNTLAGKDGGGFCTVCHTVTEPRVFHHTTSHAKVGECEYCHDTPGFADWGAATPGDNGGSSPYPTQLACVKCHMGFSGGTMTVTQFEHGKTTNYSTDFARSVKDSHTISGMTVASINTYAICMGCHYVGSSKVPASAQVKLYHAKPTWTSPDEYGERGSCRSGSGVYAPGRASSSMGHFLIFQKDFGRLSAYPSGASIQCQYDNLNPNVNRVPTLSRYTGETNPYVKFSMITVPYLAQNGNSGAPSSMAIPVLPSVVKQTVASAGEDNVKISTARWTGSKVYVVANTSNSAGCSTLTATYNGYNQVFAGITSCVANFPPTVLYTPAIPTLDVTTSNPLGVSVSGYQISVGAISGSDLTPPLASAVTVVPSTGSHVTADFALRTNFIDEESEVTACEYTTDGTTWNLAELSGSGPMYVCTTNLSGESGALTLNMRATSTGGLATASAITRTVDMAPPVDGALMVTSSSATNNLTWTAATDVGSGLDMTRTYDLRFQIGSVPPTCTTGYSLYQGTDRYYLHTSLSNGTRYSYRVCAYDNLDNVSIGATGSAIPQDVTPPVVWVANASPVWGSWVPNQFTMGTVCTDTETPVTSCEYTTNYGAAPATIWKPGLVVGCASDGMCLCSANVSGVSGNIAISIRATSEGGVGTAVPLNLSVDSTAPVDRALTITAGGGKNSLSWIYAVDYESQVQRYDVRFQTGTEAPPTCTSGISAYDGPLAYFDHTGLIAGTTYSYRVCAFDGVGNVSIGATGSGTPLAVIPTLTLPTATAITSTSATLGANITVGAPLLARGTFWGLTSNPTTNQLADGGTATGIFSQNRTELPPGTKIYYRGYATNSLGTSYSPGGSFFTAPAN